MPMNRAVCCLFLISKKYSCIYKANWLIDIKFQVKHKQGVGKAA